MKIILLTDVKNVGRKGDLKEVSDGYGRNYLIAKGLAVEATKRSMEILNKQKDDARAQQNILKAKALETKEFLEKQTINFKVKAGKEGKIFGSVSTARITDELKNLYNIEVDKRKFVDSANLTELGSHQVRVKLFEGVIATLNIEIEAE